jgi:lysozyme
MVFMTISQNAVDLIKEFEGFKTDSYQDTGGVWTIGYGTIEYPSGQKVGPGEVIGQALAEHYLGYEIGKKVAQLNDLNLSLNQNQFDALSSFIYNIGFGAFKNSTLRRMIAINPNDPNIQDQFLRWSYDNGKYVVGLNNRRKKEAELYFSIT